MHVYDLAREVQELREEVRRLREELAAREHPARGVDPWPYNTFPRF